MDQSIEDQLIDLIPDLRRYARSLERNRADADDLLHTTLERALRKQHLYQPTGKLISWLMMIMRNCLLDTRRRARIAPMASLEAMPPSAEQAAPENQFHRVALTEVTGFIAKLSPEHREILKMVVIDGLSYDSAATRLGVPLGTVRSRVFRARERLMEQMQGPV
jgi:RNA polymerase sigma-70 factor, ECF subfamily